MRVIFILVFGILVVLDGVGARKLFKEIVGNMVIIQLVWALTALGKPMVTAIKKIVGILKIKRVVSRPIRYME
jgi:hypothetical protein